MAESTEGTAVYPRRRYSTTVDGVVTTLELVTIGIILAFVFRSFIVEAFRIPTGSMAETLCGAHYHVRCTRCGFGYDIGADTVSYIKSRCPSCSFEADNGFGVPMSNGDRILVLKCIYQFHDPERWDVVVFRNPSDPSEAYIKRLVGRPGEDIEIIDGDVYINGRIARKPERVQEELWMCVYDNDYQPSWEMIQIARGGDEETSWKWLDRFENEEGSNWDLSKYGSRVFKLDSNADDVHTIFYNAKHGNSFRATYGYNQSGDQHLQPFCSDLRTRFYVIPESDSGVIGAGLKKYQTVYEGEVTFDGKMIISMWYEGVKEELATRQIEKPVIGEAVKFTFMNIDHMLILDFGGERLRYDLGPGPDAMGDRDKAGQPGVKIFGSGTMELCHTRIDRDMHYTTDRAIRASEGRSFRIDEDEFFVCGDNSPNSHDARLWASAGKGNNGTMYRMGVVPRDYLMGKAFFLYWGDAGRPFENSLPVVPNFGRLKFIVGGGGKEY